MSKLFHISDTHLGFPNIIKFESEYRPFSNIKDHDDWIVESHNSVVSPRDKTIFYGDVARTLEDLERLASMNGVKHLVLGNHDDLGYENYRKYFEKVFSMKKKGNHEKGKCYWMTHIPVHPSELDYRVNFNVHGHLHSRKVLDHDPRYINVCVEHCAAKPMQLQEWINYHDQRRK